VPGIFFGVSSRERAIVITSLKIGTHPKLGGGGDGGKGKELTVTVYVARKGVVENKQLGDTDVVRGIVLDRCAGLSPLKRFSRRIQMEALLILSAIRD